MPPGYRVRDKEPGADTLCRDFDQNQWLQCNYRLGCCTFRHFTVRAIVSQYQLPVIDITEIPLVALDTMNEVHREEVALINQLGELVIAGVEGSPDSEAISFKLNEWVAHTRAHFEGENKMMKEYGFPPYPVHMGEHQQALSRIESLQQQWLGDNQLDRLAEYIFVEWLEWFKAHVNSMDMVTARFLSQFI